MKKKQYLAKGKRSVVYSGLLGKKKVVMKVEKKTEAKNVIKNEAKWLRILNRYGIGPKLYKEGKDYIILEQVKGDRIIDWLKKNKKKEVIKVLKEILKECRTLDTLKVNKKELQHPIKHIIIGKKPKMIDFERCKRTEKPKNVTQFGQFLMSANVSCILKGKGIVLNKKKFIRLLKKYKKEQTEKNFKKILSLKT